MTAPAPVGSVHDRRSVPAQLALHHLEHDGGADPIDEDGRAVFALAESADWPDDAHAGAARCARACASRTASRSPPTSIKHNFDEMQRWAAPHPPGTWLNFPPESVCRGRRRPHHPLPLPRPDGLAVGKLRGFHIALDRVLEGPRRPGVRLQEVRLRRRPLVSDRRAWSLGHRPVHPGPGCIVHPHPQRHHDRRPVHLRLADRVARTARPRSCSRPTSTTGTGRARPARAARGLPQRPLALRRRSTCASRATVRSTSSPRSPRPTPRGCTASEHARPDRRRRQPRAGGRLQPLAAPTCRSTSVDVRKALNLAVDRDRLIERRASRGYANALPALTPPWCAGFPEGAAAATRTIRTRRARPLEKGGWPDGRPLRIASPEPFARPRPAGRRPTCARALDLDVEVDRRSRTRGCSPARELLVEKKLDAAVGPAASTPGSTCRSEAPPAAVHREFFRRLPAPSTLGA